MHCSLFCELAIYAKRKNIYSQFKTGFSIKKSQPLYVESVWGSTLISGLKSHF